MNYVTESNNGELPIRFHGWYDLYCKWMELVDKGQLKPGEYFQHEWLDDDGRFHKATFQQDYVKARCFDELTAQPFTYDEMMIIDRGCHQLAKESMSTIDRLTDFFSKVEAHRKLSVLLKLF